MVSSNRQHGSLDEFKRQWREAVEGDSNCWCIYPSLHPTTQAELDESIKAVQIEKLLSELSIQKGCTLEHGCGAAGMSIYFANLGFQTIACDISLDALRMAVKNASRYLSANHIGAFQVIAGDTFSLPFPDSCFNIVMSYGLLEHFAPEILGSVLGEAVRTLSPDGLFLADIAHGRFSIRSVGAGINLFASLIAHLITFRWDRMKYLPKAYLHHYYENTLGSEDWVCALKQAGLKDVEVCVCRPFPPLALSGGLERFYVRILKVLRPFWDWFDRTQPRWGRNWGWMYLIWGRK